jgi:hypothetical protein
MPIIAATNNKRSDSERKAIYRANNREKVRNSNRETMRKARNYYAPEFVGVDSEGIGEAANHRAVLLGVGAERHGQYENTTGLEWKATFDHLYNQYGLKPHAAYVGFYLGYDFNEWLRSLPEQTAWWLLSSEGQARRKVPEIKGKFPGKTHYPVRCDGWEIDMLGFKRLSLRPMVCDCKDSGRDKYLECEHKQERWMHICDAGPFFQMPFIKVISRDLWKNDPDGWPITEEEYELVLAGKQRRANAELDDEMRMYNRLENELLARVMRRLDKGFQRSGIRLGNDQWYGPGAAASKWLAMQPISKRHELEKKVPQWWAELCHDSYYGGWFEIFFHGLIAGSSWNYDINNAYPYAIAHLPCAECGTRSRGQGEIPGSPAPYTLVYATVTTLGDEIGAVPYRDQQGGILRPKVSRGWYWLDEIQAADKAKLVESVDVHEWAMYWPNPKCKHGNRPLKQVEDMYYERLRVGKASAQGMAIKLTNNSDYGKFAQSVGSAPFGNWFYASRITATCRIQILHAIASHPNGKKAVAMVATDGVCFDTRHPALPISKNLGEWEESEYTDLCLFKPGVYWHKAGKESVLKAKTRGVPAREFVKYIDELEEYFSYWHDIPESRPIPGVYKTYSNARGYFIEAVPTWPTIDIPIGFSMTSCRMALNIGKWDRAGVVNRVTILRQSSDPDKKRRLPWYNEEKQRLQTRIHDLEIIDTVPYGQAKRLTLKDYGYNEDGEARDGIALAVNGLHGETEIPEDIEWELVYG